MSNVPEIKPDPFFSEAKPAPEPVVAPDISMADLMAASRSDTEPPRELENDAFGIHPANASTSPEEIDWLVHHLLSRQGVGILYGASKSLKTFAALHMAFCVGLGRNFLGREVEKGFALYWAGEGKQGFPIRKEAWKQQHGDFEGVFDWHEPFQFGDKAQLDLLARHCQNKFGKHLRLIVVDTLSKAKLGGDFSTVSPDDIAKFLGGLEALANKLKCFVLVVTHENAKGSIMGTVQQIANVDFMANMKRTNVEGDLFPELRIDKVKEGVDGFKVQLELALQTFESGASSLAMVDDGKPEAVVGREKTAKFAMLYYLKEHPNSQMNSIRSFVVMASGVKPDSVGQTVRRAVTDSQIVKLKNGRYSLGSAGDNIYKVDRLETLFEDITE